MAYHAQLKQDETILNEFFPEGLLGYAVDIGASNGIELSNTKALEDAGWKCLCIEADTEQFKELIINRKGPCVKACVYGEITTVHFVRDTRGHLYNSIANTQYNNQTKETIVNTEEMETRLLSDILDMYNAPREIDYLSMDTEGAELEILMAFPFDRYSFKVISLHHNFSPKRNTLHLLLRKHGYRFYRQNQWEDWILGPNYTPPNIEPYVAALYRGGLGNQLFSAGTTIKYALDNGLTPGWSRDHVGKYSFETDMVTYFDSLIKLPEVKLTNPEVIKDRHLTTFQLPQPKKKHVLLEGYFIQKCHVPPPNVMKLYLNGFGTGVDSLKSTPPGDKAFAVHVRRGDFLTAFPHETERMERYTQMAIDEALKREPEASFVFFSDDFEYVSNKYAHIPRSSFLPTGDNIKDLQYMASFQNHIISNSTWAWWGAYLSEGNGLTFAPYPWFFDRPNCDLYLDHWVRIETLIESKRVKIGNIEIVHNDDVKGF